MSLCPESYPTAVGGGELPPLSFFIPVLLVVEGSKQVALALYVVDQLVEEPKSHDVNRDFTGFVLLDYPNPLVLRMVEPTMKLVFGADKADSLYAAALSEFSEDPFSLSSIARKWLLLSAENKFSNYNRHILSYLYSLVGPAGFEPTTSTV